MSFINSNNEQLNKTPKMPKQRLLYVEGFIKYTPSKIEKALEERLASRGLELSVADEPYWQNIGIDNCLLWREAKNLRKPFELQYERHLDYSYERQLYKEIKNLPGKGNLNDLNGVENYKCPIDFIQAHLRKNTYDDISIKICEDLGHLALRFNGGRLTMLWYDDSEELIIPFVESAFLRYRGKEYLTSNPEYLGSEEYFTKSMVDSFEPSTPQERKKLYRDSSSIHIVNMIVDEFARVLPKSGYNDIVKAG